MQFTNWRNGPDRGLLYGKTEHRWSSVQLCQSAPGHQLQPEGEAGGGRISAGIDGFVRLSPSLADVRKVLWSPVSNAHDATGDASPLDARHHLLFDNPRN